MEKRYDLGLVSVSFRKNSPEEILNAASAAGLSFIEWGSDVHAPCHDTERLKEIAALQKEYGIVCSSYGTYFRLGETRIEELETYIQAAKILGTDLLRLWCGVKSGKDMTKEEREEFGGVVDWLHDSGCDGDLDSVDVPLLRSRLVMNRMSDSSIPPVHADVLYPARRLWKLRLRQCTLGHLENQLLGVERVDDLPGAMVPQAYFQYLKDRNFAPMEKVLEHNRQDIVSLAQLFYELCRQMAPNVPMAAAGGLPGGEIGTDFERIYEAIASVGGDDGVAVLFDLGSALMTTEMVVEQFEDFPVRLVNAPIVEGAVLAAVTAEGGATLDEVLAEYRTVDRGTHSVAIYRDRMIFGGKEFLYDDISSMSLLFIGKTLLFSHKGTYYSMGGPQFYARKIDLLYRLHHKTAVVKA